MSKLNELLDKKLMLEKQIADIDEFLGQSDTAVLLLHTTAFKACITLDTNSELRVRIISQLVKTQEENIEELEEIDYTLGCIDALLTDFENNK